MSENITPSKKIHSLDDARKLAKKRLPKMFFDFVAVSYTHLTLPTKA